MIRFREVVQGTGTHTDEQNRLATRPQKYTKPITINPQQVVSVEPMPSTIVESEGDSPTALSRVVTVMGTHIVVGSHTTVEAKLLGDKRRILKG